MHKKLNQKYYTPWIFFLIFILTSLCFSPIFAGENDDKDSIQAVFKAAQEAGVKKDFATLTKLVAPSERAMMAFSSDFGVSMFVEFYEGPKAEELKKRYQDIQDKYEIKEEDDSEKLHITQDTPQEVIDAHVRKQAEKKYGTIDLVKYVPEIMAIIIDMPEMAEQTFFPQEELTELKVDGDHATGKAGENTISFVREDGNWYLTADVIK